MSKFSLLMVIIFIGFAYILGVNDTGEIIIQSNITRDNYIVNETICKKIEIERIRIEQKEYIPAYFNVSINLTSTQKYKAKKARIACNNWGCGEGAARMKNFFLDLLNIPRSKFNERPSIGYNAVDLRTYLPVDNDSRGEYIKLNNTEWFVYNGRKEYNLSFLCYGNKTWTKNQYSTNYKNKTYTEDNLSYQNETKWFSSQGKELYLRKV